MHNGLNRAWIWLEEYASKHGGILSRVQDHHEYTFQNDTIRILPMLGSGDEGVCFRVHIRQESQPLPSERDPWSTEPKMRALDGEKSYTQHRTVEFTCRNFGDTVAILHRVMTSSMGWTTYEFGASE